jgi:hypothetical protein
MGHIDRMRQGGQQHELIGGSCKRGQVSKRHCRGQFTGTSRQVAFFEIRIGRAQQDSNLRTRLRRGLPYAALTSGNVLPGVPPERVLGTVRPGHMRGLLAAADKHWYLRFFSVSFQQHERNLACGVPLVHVVSTPRAGVHDRSETHVVAVDERPQPFALLS